MTGLQAFILGLIQGLAEFLPISSSGHLVLFQRLFGLEEGVVTFDIALHLATLAAVMIIMRKEIFEMIRKPFSKLTLMVIVGTIPTVIIGFLFKICLTGYLFRAERWVWNLSLPVSYCGWLKILQARINSLTG